MPPFSPSELTKIINALPDGQASRKEIDRLIEVAYQELRGLARGKMQHERPGHTLQATALVHELYLRLVDDTAVRIDCRKHFFGIMSNVLRQVLVQHARALNAEKRGGSMQRVEITVSGLPGGDRSLDVIELDDALTKYARVDERGATVVEMKFFADMGMQDIADVIGVSRRTVQTDLSMALMWFKMESTFDLTT